MRLDSLDGARVTLRPLGYQFETVPSSGDDVWDPNWLVVRGEIVLADGRSWAFTDPCLTTFEGRRLGAWLEGVIAGEVRPAPLDEDDERGAVFLEPVIAFSLAERDTTAVTLRVHLSLEALPPWATGTEKPEIFAYWVKVRCPVETLESALLEWNTELESFPVRGPGPQV